MEANWFVILLTAGALALAVPAVLAWRSRRSGGGRKFPAGGSANAGGSSPGLQGSLAQTPMHDLLQFLALGKRTGVLGICSGRRAGSVWFRSGSVMKNTFRGKDGLEGIFQLLDLKEGDFEFQEQPVARSEGEAVLEVVDVIMLWMNRTAERRI